MKYSSGEYIVVAVMIIYVLIFGWVIFFTGGSTELKNGPPVPYEVCGYRHAGEEALPKPWYTVIVFSNGFKLKSLTSQKKDIEFGYGNTYFIVYKTNGYIIWGTNRELCELLATDELMQYWYNTEKLSFDETTGLFNRR